LGKRYTLLAAMIAVFFTALSWQLMDENVIPSDSFMQKLIVATGVTVAIWFATRFLLGKKEEGVHL